jgi:hypothetical protein
MRKRLKKNLIFFSIFSARLAMQLRFMCVSEKNTYECEYNMQRVKITIQIFLVILS